MDGSQRPLTLGSEPYERHGGGGHRDSDNDEGPDDEDKDAV